MDVFSAILVTIIVAGCYYIYNYFMFSFFDILTVQSTSLKLRSAIALVNYIVFIILSEIHLYLFVNWTIIGVIFILEMYLIYHCERLMSVTLGLQGAVMGLAINSITRCFSAMLSGLPLATFDSWQNQQVVNLSQYPIAIGFILTGLAFMFLCYRFKNWVSSEEKYKILNIRFLFAMNLCFFLYMDLNLFIYLAEGRETIIKLWGIKSAVCVLIGNYICYTHILALSKFHAYERKSKNAREELHSYQIANERLESAAYYDVLTNCRNRTAAVKILEEYAESKTPFILCYLDLDKLKDVNDHFGHESGDNYLVAVSHVLREIMGEQALIYRYGGDEFLIIDLEDDSNQISRKMEDVSSTLKEHSYSSGHPYTLSVSYGIASTEECATVEDLLKLADLRMYENKEAKETDAVKTIDKIQKTEGI